MLEWICMGSLSGIQQNRNITTSLVIFLTKRKNGLTNVVSVGPKSLINADTFTWETLPSVAKSIRQLEEQRRGRKHIKPHRQHTRAKRSSGV